MKTGNVKRWWWISRRGALGLVLILSLLSAAAIWAAPVLQITKVDTLALDNDSDGRFDPGDRIRYTVTITNTGDATALNLVFNDTLDGNTTLLGGSLKTSPMAANDSFSALGNVRISHGAGALTGNDFGLPTPAVVAASGTSAQGGNYTVNADGSFSYDPPAGYEGADSFSYTLQNSTGTDTATVTINVNGMIWFVNGAAGACSSNCGRLSSPFNSLEAFRAVNDGSGNHPAANDSIFIYQHSSDYALSGSLTLLSGQRLIGQDAASDLATLAGAALPTGSDALPAMLSGDGTVARLSYSASGPALTLGSNNQLHGLTVGAGNPAISGTNFGTLAVSGVTINAGGSAALLLNIGTVNGAFTSVSSSGGGVNVDLNAVVGALNLGGGALSGGTTAAFRATQGTAVITYSGTIASAARSVLVQNRTGGSVTFNGAVSGTGTGVYLNNNGTSTVNFAGGLTLNTGTSHAFDASGTGVVNVTGAGNILTTTTGTALRVSNYTIGSGGLTFRSISSNGGSNPGIDLSATGTQGGLTVTGDGGGSANGSGGTIQNKSGNAVSLSSAQNISLNFMNITGNLGSGIYGSNVTNFTLNRSAIQNNSDVDTGNEANLWFANLWGTSAISNSTISGAYYDNIRLGLSSGTSNLNITGSTVGPNNSTRGNHGLKILGSGSGAFNLRVDGSSQFNSNRSSAIFTSFVDNSTQHITVTNSSFADNNIGLELTHDSTQDRSFDITGNSFLRQGTSAVSIADLGNAGAYTDRGAIVNNTIGNGTTNSGSNYVGLSISQRLSSRQIIRIAGNTIKNTDYQGIIISTGDGGSGDIGSLNLTLTGNTVQVIDSSYDTNAIEILSFENSTLCADISSNTASGTGAGAAFFLYSSSSVPLGLNGYSGSVAATLAARGNPGLVDSVGTFGACTAQTWFLQLDRDKGLASLKPFATPAYVRTAAAPCAAASVSTAESPAPADDPAVKAGKAARPAVSALRLMPEPRPAATLVTYIEAPEPRQPGLASWLPAGWLHPVASGETVSVGPFSLPAGKSIIITFEATINNPAPDGVTQVGNQGQATGSNVGPVASDDPDVGGASDPTVSNLDIQADLGLTKSDGGVTGLPGGTVQYTLYYTNTGPQSAGGVVLTETVPANAAFNSGASTAGWSCVGSVCTLSRGSLAIGASGSAVFAVTVANPVPAGLTQITNGATIGSLIPDPVAGNNTANDTTPIEAAPDLRVTKNEGGAAVVPGGTIIYTVYYTNTGNQDATGVVLTETVPANTAFTGSGWICTPHNGAGSTCTSMVAGEVVGGGGSGAKVFQVTVLNPVPAGVAQISNSVTIGDNGTNGADLNPADNSGSDTTTVNAAPDLRVTKSDGGASAVPGGSILYTLYYTNTGNQGATGVVLTETVPSNAAFSGTGWTCTPNNQAGSICTAGIGGLASGASGSRTFAVTVDNPVAAGLTQIGNSAVVGDDGANGADPTPGNNTGSDTTPVTAVPDLAIGKTDGGARGVPGGGVAYTLYFTNTGNQGATGMILSDVVPQHTTFSPGASSAGWSCTPNNQAGSTCTLAVAGPLAGGGASDSRIFAVTADNPFPLAEPAITNTATLVDDGTNGTDPNSGNNSSTDVTPIDNLPDLKLTKGDGDLSVTPNGWITYTLSYTNSGGLAAPNTRLTETVPANTSFDPARSTAGWSCTPGNGAGSTCTLNLGTLGSQGAGTAVFVVRLQASPLPAGLDQISNTAEIGYDGSNGEDPNPGNNHDTETTPVDAAPDLRLAKSDGGISAVPGGPIPYTLTYTNTGTQNATGVSLVETVPANTTFDSAASTAGWICAPNGQAGGICRFTAGNLAVGNSGTAVFAVRVVNPVAAGVAQIANTARVEDDLANGPDPVPADNEASDTTPVVAAPDLTLSKTDGGAGVAPGSSVVYTLTYTNLGNQGATGVIVTETVPANTVFSGTGWTCTPNLAAGSNCLFTVPGAVAGGGGSGTVVYRLTVNSPVPAGVTEIANTAMVGNDGTNGTDSNPANDTAADVTPLVLRADVQLAKSATPATARAGEWVTYTVAFVNNGPEAAVGGVITDIVPAQLVGVTYSSTGAVLTRTAGITYVWQVAPLMPGEGGEIEVSGRIGTGLTPGAFANTAKITSAIEDPLPANNERQASVTVVNSVPAPNAGPDQTVTVSATVTLDGRGSTDPDLHLPLTYEWEQTNGPAVTLSDRTAVQPTFTPPATPAVLTFGLTVTDALGLVETNPDTVVITVTDTPIVNLAAVSSSPTRLGETTTFTAAAGGSNLVYAWAFGDGQTGSGANPTHSYGAVGNYTAIVTATNGVSTVVTTTPVRVIDQPITNLGATSNSPTRLGDTTLLTATAGGTNLLFAWAFGDGQTGSGANPTHIYGAVGNYTAIVTATNGVSSVVTTTPVVVIDQPITNLGTASSSPTTLGQTTFLTVTAAGTNIAYTWAFGDGQTGSGATPNHVYPAVGNYTATVTATNGVSAVVATTGVQIVDQAVTTASVLNSSPTRLDDTTYFTVTSDGSNVVYTWAFGDGQTATGAAVSHVYAAAGGFTAVATATNGVGRLVTATPVTVTNGAPAADAGGDQTVLGTLPVTLDGRSSADPDGHTPLTYGWLQTGGPAVTLSDRTAAQPTFSAPGTGAVLTFTLTVTDAHGLADSTPDAVVVTVNDPAILALTAANSGPAPVGRTVYFTSTATGTDITYTWDFGDGQPGAGALVSHAYALNGVFTATVTATNGVSTVVATTPVTIFLYKNYVPLNLARSASGPDLVVRQITALTRTMQVVIQNVGDQPATSEFWVDAYISPTVPPTRVNQGWDLAGDFGLSWGIVGAALPLDPGEVLTLTFNDAYYMPNYSRVSWPLAIGTPIYAQVDSVDSSTNYGAVLESHEIADTTYNNILGPVAVGASGSQRAVELDAEGPVAKGGATLKVRLPQRP